MMLVMIMMIIFMTSWAISIVVACRIAANCYCSCLPCAKRLADMISSRRGSNVVCYCGVRRMFCFSRELSQGLCFGDSLGALNLKNSFQVKVDFRRPCWGFGHVAYSCPLQQVA